MTLLSAGDECGRRRAVLKASRRPEGRGGAEGRTLCLRLRCTRSEPRSGFIDELLQVIKALKPPSKCKSSAGFSLNLELGGVKLHLISWRHACQE